jgi:septum formation protein
MKSVLLASTSPRRSDLLAQIGVPFTVVAPDYEEDMTLGAGDDPEDLAMELALGKAMSVQHLVQAHQVIVAADTFIEFEEELLGKPHTPERAREMLRMIRGKTNIVHTGYCVASPADEQFTSGTVSSYIEMAEYSDEMIDRYIETGEPLDKAGAYAITGMGAILIDRVVDGDVSAIIGLPLGPVATALVEYGVSVWQTIR